MSTSRRSDVRNWARVAVAVVACCFATALPLLQVSVFANNPSACSTGRTGSGYKPSGSHYFDGVDATDHGNEIGGVSSNMLDYAPSVKSSGTFSDQWVMLKQEIPCQYAQVGWEKDSTSDPQHVFVEYSLSNNQVGCSRYLAGCVPACTHEVINFPTSEIYDTPPDYHTFKVQYGPCTTGCTPTGKDFLNAFAFYHDTTQIYYYPVNDADASTGNWFVPDLAEIRGEVGSYVDQMPGDRSHHEKFKDNQLCTGPDGSCSWGAFGTKWWDPSYQTDNFGSQLNADGSLEIWDQQCS